MSYPSDAPGAYPYHAAGTVANAFTVVPGRGYSSSSDTGSGASSGAATSGTDYSTDGYSSSASNGNGNGTSAGYVDFVPGAYQQQHHLDQHALAPAVNNPYPSHPQQFHASPPQPPIVPNPVYDHPEEMYAASLSQQQQQQQQQHNGNMQQQSPTSIVPPPPQAIHPAPTQAQRTTPVVPALPQNAPTNRQQQAQQQQYQRIARFVGPPPVALACTECRARHLKCDAGVPACNRCQTDGRECSYVKSRRGWKGTRRKKAAAAAAAKETKSGPEEGSLSGETKENATAGKVPLSRLYSFFSCNRRLLYCFTLPFSFSAGFKLFLGLHF